MTSKVTQGHRDYYGRQSCRFTARRMGCRCYTVILWIATVVCVWQGLSLAPVA